MSIKAGEETLLPAVRNADKDTLIISDGFSCREQIAQLTNRKGLHLSQVMQMALREQGKETASEYPEKIYVDGMALSNPHKNKKRWIAAGLLIAGVAIYLLVKNKKES